MKHKTMPLKSKSCSYLMVLLLFITSFLLVGCENHYVKWNEETNRFESVGSTRDETGTVKEISDKRVISPLRKTSTTQAKSPIVEMETVTIPALKEPPPPADYIVGPNDSIMVTVSGAPEYSSGSSGSNGTLRGSRVDGNGNIQMPTLGLVKVDGMTLSQIRDHIQDLLKQYIKKPSVVVEITEYKSYPLYILGQFKNTGIFYMDRPFNVLQGLALAGGYDSSANPKSARIIRKKRVLPVDVYELLMNADQTQNIWLKPGDTIFMPDNKNQTVFVFGVGKPGMSITLPPSGLNLLQAIATAGLEKVGYHARRVYLIRSISPTRGQLMVVDVEAIIRGDAYPLQLCEGDVIYIPKSGLTTWNEAVNEMLPTLQAFGAILTPFVQLKYLFGTNN
jgi:Periplasmic protein involved in polysaccharide export